MGRKLTDERKCIVCGCTDNRACDGGCEWISTAPPVCSSCVATYLFAKLWSVLFALEDVRGPAQKLIGEVRALYSYYEPSKDLGIPTLRKVCQINRNHLRWLQRMIRATQAKKGVRAR